MQVLSLQLQIPSMAISAELSSSSSPWTGLRCRIPSPVIKNGNLRGQVLMMGGGPRTFPGGVTKWQWKRMQNKKAKQLLKARLLRERQLYEMRKRAELRAAAAELEKPWEKMAKAPALFAVTADEQLRALADRFQKPGGFDLWTDTDGPDSFRTLDGRPSARFFPKGAVHSTLPYSRVHSIDSGDARSSRSETPFQAREYGEKPRGGGSNPARSPRQGYASRSSDNSVNLKSNKGSGSREAHNFTGKRQGEGFSSFLAEDSDNGMNLKSNEGPGSQEAHYFTGKREGKGFSVAEDGSPGGRHVTPSDGRDSNSRRGSYSQVARNSEKSRRGAAAGSSLMNGSRQRRGSLEEEVYGMESNSAPGNCSWQARIRGIRASSAGSNFVNDRGRIDGSLDEEVCGSLDEEVCGVDLTSRQGDSPQRARDGSENHQIEAPAGTDLADDLQGRDRSPFEKVGGMDLNSMHGSSSSSARGFTGKPRRSSGGLSSFAGFDL